MAVVDHFPDPAEPEYPDAPPFPPDDEHLREFVDE